MSDAEWKVAVGGEHVSAIYELGETRGAGRSLHSGRQAVFVCAHGAGGNISDRGTVASANALLGQGFGVVRFNFLYKEKKSGRPDPMPKLMETVAAVVARAREELAPETLLIGGRSMGGRAASMLAADGFDADGLLLLAYPLHPAGQPLSFLRHPPSAWCSTASPGKPRTRRWRRPSSQRMAWASASTSR